MLQEVACRSEPSLIDICVYVSEVLLQVERSFVILENLVAFLSTLAIREKVDVSLAHCEFKDLSDKKEVFERYRLRLQDSFVVFQEKWHLPLHIVRNYPLIENVRVRVTRIDSALKAITEESLQGINILPNSIR